MRTTTINDPLHNPFRNRFHDPVTCRLDEMQSHSNLAWLRERHNNATIDRAEAASENKSEFLLDRSLPGNALESNTGGRVFASAFALAAVIVASVIVLF